MPTFSNYLNIQFKEKVQIVANKVYVISILPICLNVVQQFKASFHSFKLFYTHLCTRWRRLRAWCMQIYIPLKIADETHDNLSKVRLDGAARQGAD